MRNEEGLKLLWVEIKALVKALSSYIKCIIISKKTLDLMNLFQTSNF